MKILLAALAALPFLSFSPIDEIVSATEEGLVLEKTFDQVFELELVSTELALVIDDEEQEQEAPDVSVTLHESEHILFTDEVLETRDGRATKIKRTFDELAGVSKQSAVGPDGDGEETESDASSELEGTTVLFTFDDDDESWQVEFAEGEKGDEDLLEPLEAETDLAWLLPDGDVDEGDTWEVDIEYFEKISAPCGDLAIISEDEEEDDPDFEEQFNENLQGEIGCTYSGTREEDGRKLAVITVTAELSTEIHQEEELELPDVDGAEGTTTQDFAFEFELEGELLWDTAAGHAVSFDFGGDMGLEIATVEALTGAQGSLEFRNTQAFEGEVRFEVRFE